MTRALLAAAACAALAPCRAQAADQPDSAPSTEAREARPGTNETVVRAPRNLWDRVLGLADSDGRDAVEALAREGAVAKVRRGGQSHDVVVRGQQRDNLAVTVDGSRVFGACPNRMDPPASHVEAGEVEVVEVRRGPFDVTTPGSLGGSVSARTRPIRAGAHGELRLSSGNFGELRADGTASWGGEQVRASAGGTFRQAEPFRDGAGLRETDVYPASSPNRYRALLGEGLDHRSGGAWGRVGGTVSEGHALEASYTHLTLREAIYPYLLMDAARDDTDRASLSWAFERLGPLRKGGAQVSLARVEHDMDDARRCSASLVPGACTGGLPEAFGMRTLATTWTIGARFEALAGPAEDDPWGETLWGVDFDQRRWDATTTRLMRTASPLAYDAQAALPQVSVWRAGAFAEHRRRLHPSVRLLAGVRLDGARSSAGVDRSALYRRYYPSADLALTRTDWMPAGNLRLEVQPVRPLTLLAGLGHAQRTPDPQERYYALGGMGGKPGTAGRPDLAPPATTEVDLGAQVKHSVVRLSGQAFFARLGRYIVPALRTGDDGSTSKGFASVAARTYGAEAAAKVSLPLGLGLRASMLFTQGDNLTDGVPLPEIPPLQVQGALLFDHEAVFAEVEEVWAARQDRVDPRLQESATPAWFITNLRLGLRYRGVQLSASLRNLFDRQYVEHLGYLRDPFASGVRVPEPGRTVLVTLRSRL